ncbi:MAG: hypothetical protein ACOVPA_10215 [Rubrivivax sp.]|jgi:hypothetical protein
MLVSQAANLSQRMSSAQLFGYFAVLCFVGGWAALVVCMLGYAWLAYRWRIRMVDKSLRAVLSKPALVFTWPYEIVKPGAWSSDPEARVARVVCLAGLAALIFFFPLLALFLFVS